MAMHLSRRVVIPALVVGVPAVAVTAWVTRDTATFADTGAAIRAPLDTTATGRAQLSEIVRFATLAPNSHNTQAWQFSSIRNQVSLSIDSARSTPIVDPDNHHAFVSLGAAAETLVIAASAYGLTARPVFDAASNAVNITFSPGAATSSLLSAVTNRQSNRSIYDGTALTASERTALVEATAGLKTASYLIEDDTTKTDIRSLVRAANIEQMDNPAFVAELLHWLRFSESNALASSDGLFAGCSGNPSLPQWIGERVFPFVYKKASENAKIIAQIDSSAALVLLVSAGDNPEHWVETGRALVRLTLRATELGLAHAYINQAVEVPAQRAALAHKMGITSGRASILLRIGRASIAPYSLRRPVIQVLS